MNLQEIKQKVQKLLSLSRCEAATPAEADLARQKAQELLQKAGLGLDSLSFEEEEVHTAHRPLEASRRLARWRIDVADAIAQHHHGFILVSRQSDTTYLEMIGRNQDARKISYLYQSMIHQILTIDSEYGKMNPVWHNNFRTGIAYGLKSILDLRRHREHNLLIQNTISRYLDPVSCDSNALTLIRDNRPKDQDAMRKAAELADHLSEGKKLGASQSKFDFDAFDEGVKRSKELKIDSGTQLELKTKMLKE